MVPHILRYWKRNCHRSWLFTLTFTYYASLHFLQHESPCHTSRKVRIFRSLRRLLAGKLPDLNVAENTWNLLNKKFSKHNHKCLASLKEIIVSRNFNRKLHQFGSFGVWKNLSLPENSGLHIKHKFRSLICLHSFGNSTCWYMRFCAQLDDVQMHYLKTYLCQ